MHSFVKFAVFESSFAAVLGLTSLLTLGAGAARGALVTSVWNGTTGNWSDATKWSSANYPDNGNGGVATYDAVINSGVVTLDVNVTIESFTYNVFATDFTRNGNITINDTFDWSKGDLAGSGDLTLAPNATANVSAGNVNNEDGDIVNHGTFNWTSGSRLLFRDALFMNHGTADAQADGTFIERNSFASSNSTYVTNTGTFLKSAGTGDTLIRDIKFNNSGTVEVRTGGLGFTLGSAGAPQGYTQTAGTLWLNGGDVFVDDVPMDIQGGSIEGEGTISGDIVLAGTIAPGQSIGTLVIDDDARNAAGNLTFAPGGEYVAELGDPGAADLLAITGTLDLATMGDSLTLSGGVFGETYTIATYANVSGLFDNVTPGYMVNYGATALTVVAIPEPTSLTLFVVAIFAVGGRWRAKGVSSSIPTVAILIRSRARST